MHIVAYVDINGHDKDWWKMKQGKGYSECWGGGREGVQSHTADVLQGQDSNTEHSSVKSVGLATMLKLLYGSANAGLPGC